MPAALDPGSLGDLGPVPHGREGRLDRVRGAQVDPVLGRLPVLVDLVDVRLDVGSNFSLQRRREHPPGAIADNLVQHRAARLRGWRLLAFLRYHGYRRILPTRVPARASLD